MISIFSNTRGFTYNWGKRHAKQVLFIFIYYSSSKENLMQTAFVLILFKLPPLEATTTFIIIIMINSKSCVIGIFTVLYFCPLFFFCFRCSQRLSHIQIRILFKVATEKYEKAFLCRKNTIFRCLKGKDDSFFFHCMSLPTTNFLLTVKENDSKRNYWWHCDVLKVTIIGTILIS